MNEGRGIAKFVCLQFQPDHNIKPSSISPFWGCSDEEPDSATGYKIISFELNPTKVIHPGRAIRFAHCLTIEFLYSEEGKQITLPCTIYCEGAAPVSTPPLRGSSNSGSFAVQGRTHTTDLPYGAVFLCGHRVT